MANDCADSLPIQRLQAVMARSRKERIARQSQKGRQIRLTPFIAE